MTKDIILKHLSISQAKQAEIFGVNGPTDFDFSYTRPCDKYAFIESKFQRGSNAYTSEPWTTVQSEQNIFNKTTI